jgi:hypothetical protein
MQKKGVWQKVVHLFQDIKTEAKVLTRTHGLAISIIVMTFELTELPMKAIAVAIGHPVIIVLYEVLQPAILVPAIILGAKSLVRNYKTKKYFGDKIIFKKWKKDQKQSYKAGKTKERKDHIGITVDDETYLIKPSNIVFESLKYIGLFRHRLDYSNIKRELRHQNMQTKEIEDIKSSDLPKQLKTKLLLLKMQELNPNTAELIQTKYPRAKTSLPTHSISKEIIDWTTALFNAQDAEDTLTILETYPRDISPLVLMELWGAKIMQEFFEHNNHFKLPYYRGLQKNLLPLVIKLRNKALINGFLPEWTPELQQEISQYFTQKTL